MFEVKGTPLHVRAAAFDQFDGVSWHEGSTQVRACLIEKEPRSNWMTIFERAPAAVFAAADAHQFKVAKACGALVPTPPHLTRFRVGRVDQPDFFTWSQERILRMSQRKTPTGVTVETEARTIDPRRLAGADFPTGHVGPNGDHSMVSPTLDERVAALAGNGRQLFFGLKEQIDAVIKLRSDIGWPTPRCQARYRDPLAHAGIGRTGLPIATAAAVLRTLGYRTRS